MHSEPNRFPAEFVLGYQSNQFGNRIDAVFQRPNQNRIDSKESEESTKFVVTDWQGWIMSETIEYVYWVEYQWNLWRIEAIPVI